MSGEEQQAGGIWCRLCGEPVRLTGRGLVPELRKAVHAATGDEKGPGYGDGGWHLAAPTGENPVLRAVLRAQASAAFLPKHDSDHFAVPGAGSWASRHGDPADMRSAGDYPLTSACRVCGVPIRLVSMLQMEWRHAPALAGMEELRVGWGRWYVVEAHGYGVRARWRAGGGWLTAAGVAGLREKVEADHAGRHRAGREAGR